MNYNVFIFCMSMRCKFLSLLNCQNRMINREKAWREELELENGENGNWNYVSKVDTSLTRYIHNPRGYMYSVHGFTKKKIDKNNM